MITMLNAIAQIKGVSQNTDDLIQFEKRFNASYTHILMTELKWYYNVDDPFVIINPMGVFDNLVNFSMRLYKEITSPDRGFTKECKFECEITFFGQSSLSVDIHIDNVTTHIDCRFIDANQEASNKHIEGFKFGIPKEDIE